MKPHLATSWQWKRPFAQPALDCCSLPPYTSPDLNPIVQLFAKIKTLLREASALAAERVVLNGSAECLKSLPNRQIPLGVILQESAATIVLSRLSH